MSQKPHKFNDEGMCDDCSLKQEEHIIRMNVVGQEDSKIIITPCFPVYKR